MIKECFNYFEFMSELQFLERSAASIRPPPPLSRNLGACINEMCAKVYIDVEVRHFNQDIHPILNMIATHTLNYLYLNV